MLEIDSKLGLQFNFLQLENIGSAIVDTIGEDLCEVVIHDLSQDEHSIVWIKGRVTNRNVGGSLSQIGLTLKAQGEDAKDQVNYITRTKNGKVLKSTTIVLRDIDGRVFGLFCINIDITSLVLTQKALDAFLSTDETKQLTDIHFSNSLVDVAQTILDEIIQEQNLAVPPNNVTQRRRFIQALDKRGFFGIRYAVPLLSEYIGVSRGSIYRYLKDIE